MTDTADLIVEIRSPQGRRVGQVLPKELDFEGAQVLNGTGSWSLVLPADSPRAGPLSQPGAGVVVSTTKGIVLMSGPVTKIEHEESVDNVAGSFLFSGVTDAVTFEDRLALPEPNMGTQSPMLRYDTRSGTLSSVMHGYIRANMGDRSNGGRWVDFEVSPASSPDGPTVSYKARFQPLSEVMTDLINQAYAKAPEMLYQWRYQHDPIANRIAFKVTAGTDRSGSVVFSLQNSRASGLRVSQEAPKATYAYVTGATHSSGEGNYIAEANTPVSKQAYATWNRRIEALVGGNSSGTAAETLAEGESFLAENASERLDTQAVPADTLLGEIGVTWDIGDLVGVEYPDGSVGRALVTGFGLSFGERGGRTVTATLSPTSPSPRSQAAGIAARVRRLESI